MSSGCLDVVRRYWSANNEDVNNHYSAQGLIYCQSVDTVFFEGQNIINVLYSSRVKIFHEKAPLVAVICENHENFIP